MLNLARVADAAQTLAAAPAEQLLPVFLHLLIEQTEAQHGALLLPSEPSGEQLWILAAVGAVVDGAPAGSGIGATIRTPAMLATEADVPLEIIRQVAQSSEPLLLHGTRVAGQASAAFVEQGSLLCVPLVYQQQVVGVVYLAHPQARAFTANHLHFTTILGAQVSWALVPVPVGRGTCPHQQTQLNLATETGQSRALTPFPCALVELSSIGIFRHDRQGRCVYLNAKARQLLGLTLEQVEQASTQGWLAALSPSEAFAQMRRRWQQFVQDAPQHPEATYSDEICIPDLDGGERWLLIQAEVERNSAGVVVGFSGSLVDISDCKQTELALQASEARFRQMAETLEDVFWVYDPATEHFSYVSPAYEAVWGHPPESVNSGLVNWLETLHPEDRPRVFEAMEHCLAGTNQDIEYRILRPDGELRWVRDRFYAVHTSHGWQLVGIAEDITNRKQLEAAMQDTEARLQLTLDLTQIAAWRWTPGQMIHCNANGVRLLGLPPSPAIPYDTWRNALHPEDRERVEQALLQAIETQTEFHCEYRVVWPDGSVRWLEGKGRGLQDLQGQLVEMLGVVIDITDRKQAELALRASEMQYWDIVEQQTELICRYLPDSTLTFVNEAYCRYFGRSRQELIGQPFLSLIPESERAQVMEFLATLQQSTGPVQSEHSAYRSDGEMRWMQWTDSAIRDAQGNLLEFQCVGRDITERKQLEAELHQMNQQLEQRVIERTQELQQSEQRFRDLFDAMPRIAVQGYNRQRQVIYWNRASESIYGYSASEAMGQQLEDLIIPVHLREWAVTAINQWLETGIPIPAGELELQDKAGNSVTVYSSHVMLIGPHGEPELYCVDIDLRDRKQAESALRESEERFRQLTETVESVFWMTDTEHLLYVSPAFERIWGVPVARLMESPEIWLDALHPEDRERILALRPTQVSGNYDQEYRIIRPNGELCWIRDRAFPIRNSEGEVYRIVGVAEDITAFRLAEQALQESRQFAQRIADSTPDIVYIHDLVEHRNVYSNRDMLDVIGYTLEDIAANGLDRMLALVLHPKDLEPYLQHQQRLCAAADGEILEIEYRYRHANGSWHWFYSRDTVFKRNAQGQVTQYIGTAQDITERKRLQAEQARLLKILETAPDYIGMAAPDGKTLWLNAQMKQLYHLVDATDFSQLLISDVHPQWAAEKILHEGLPQAAQQGMWLGETSLLTPEGEEIPVSQLILRHRSTSGEIEYFSTIMRDISERKQAEAALQQAYLELEARVEERTAELKHAKEAAEAASRAKTTFLTHMSHELRTPLNAILGFAQLMSRAPQLSAEQQQQLAIINRNGEHLLTLINDILEMSKIEAGRVTLNPNDFDLHRLLATVEDMFRLKAESKQLQLHCHCPADIPQFIRTDEGKLRQVLINLLGNAVKFTTAGQVSLRVSCGGPPPEAVALPLDVSSASALQPSPHCCSGDPAHGVWLWFEVQDTGPGIAAEELGRLFEPFGQTEIGRQSQEGTGLGLPISREFVQLMGGELSVTSVLHQGSCFRFCIQAIRVEPPVLQSQPRVIGVVPQAQRYRILVVEDNWANRQLLVQLLSPLGFEVRDVATGSEAIICWREWQPDLIWMDIRMPGMDGYEATRRIRAELAALPEPPQRVPVIIALTASAFEEDRMAILSAGCDDFVRKPVREQTLLEKMAHYLGVQYLYQSNLPTDELTERLATVEPLTPEHLRMMPTAWIQSFHRAAQTADEELMLQLLNQIPAEQDALAEALRQLIYNFRLDQLLHITAAVMAVQPEGAG